MTDRRLAIHPAGSAITTSGAAIRPPCGCVAPARLGTIPGEELR
ncbi:hypothetical protein GCM10027569_05570 [Flindersiella endophytica]